MFGSRWLRISITVAVVAAVAMLIVVLSVRRIWSVDYWWQWKTGQHVGEHGIPRTDVFCYTDEGVPRLELRWGYCWALYQLTTRCGHGAAVIAKTGIVLAMFGLAIGLAGSLRRGAITLGLVTVVAALAASQRFMVRPETISYAFFIAFVAIVHRRRAGPTRWMWVLPAMEILWVNCHGPYILGPAVIGVWLAEETLHRLRARLGKGPVDSQRRGRIAAATVWLTLVTACTLINPYWHKAVLLPLFQFQWLHGTAYKEFISELYSPFAFEYQFTALWYYKLLIGLVIASILMNLKNQQFFWLTIIASQFYLSATAIRNIPLFCLVAIPFIGRNVRESWIWRVNWTGRAALYARPFAAILLMGFCVYQVRELCTDRFAIKQGDTNQFGIGLARHRFAVEAAAFLKNSGAHGRIFNTSAIGSYLIAQDFKVFIGPHIQENAQRMLVEFRQIVNDAQKFDEYARHYEFRIVVVEIDMIDMIKWMLGKEDWRMLHADDVAVVFLHADIASASSRLDLAGVHGAQWVQRMMNHLGEPVNYIQAGWLTHLSNPAPYRRLGNFCFTVGNYRGARLFYEAAQRAYPPGFIDFDQLGYACSAEGDFASAARAYLQAVALAPDNRTLRLRTAAALMNSSDVPAALPHLEELLRRDPNDAEALARRGLIELLQGRSKLGEPWLRKALERQPEEPSYHAHLGRALAAQGLFDDAMSSLQKSWQLDPNNFDTARDIAALFLQWRRPREALEWIQRAELLRPNDPQALELRRIYGSMPYSTH